MGKKDKKMEKTSLASVFEPDIPPELVKLLASKVKTQADLSGPDSIMQRLFKAVVESAMSAEMDHHLGYEKHDLTGNKTGNSRNGKGKKTLKTNHGEVEIITPRDRNSTFEPALVPKRTRRFEGFDQAILSLYSRGMTTRDIESTLKELYGVDVSPTLISQVTESVEETVRHWRDRPLESLYPLIWLDGIVIKIHKDKHVVKKTVYVALALNCEGKKELLGLWISENEGSKYWTQILVELKSRGIRDVLIFCVDGLTGFPDAIESVFPASETQLCIVHMVRNSMRYVATKDMKEVAKDLKSIYQSHSIEEAESSLGDFGLKWSKKYPSIEKSWRNKWEHVIPLFSYPPEIRKIMYTTNAIESVNMCIRKAIRNRRIFPSDESAIKLVYLAIKQASEKWSKPIWDWKPAYNFLLARFGKRVEA
jgi:putative transposase